MRMYENVVYRHVDARGAVKPLFALNAFGRALLEAMRERYNPYNADGSRKTGILAHLALYGFRIP